MAAFGGELEGIFDQVGEDLVELACVCHEVGQVVRYAAEQFHSPLEPARISKRPITLPATSRSSTGAR